MSRLIDADKLIEVLRKNSIFRTVTNAEDKSVIKIIEEQPTAFDVDRVISKIWDRSELIHIKHTHNYEIEVHIRTTDASEIVRAGGINNVHK